MSTPAPLAGRYGSADYNSGIGRKPNSASPRTTAGTIGMNAARDVRQYRGWDDVERWLCSCGIDVTPRDKWDMGWVFHHWGGHKISVSELNRVVFSRASEHWATPSEVYDRLNAEFGFTFDPCPLNSRDDGLARLFTPWRGKRVFCNPPYGPEIPKWLERAGEAELAVYLLPARTDTRWFHDEVLPKAKEVRFLRGRLKFGGAENGAPFPSMVVIYRADQG